MNQQPLTAAQVAQVAAWWQVQTMQSVAAIWRECGFKEIYSCVGWNELQRTMPDVAVCIGRRVIDRERMRR